MLGTAFVLRFESIDPSLAADAARALQERIAGRGALVRIESGTRTLPGTTIVVGVRDLTASDGEPRWLAPLLVRDDATGAADDAVAFLERWGFITRRGREPSSAAGIA